MRNGVKLQAHKGVESENPENTMPAFVAAVEQGYEMIELDLRATKDDKIIILHDREINSRGRNPDGSPIAEKIYITDITYEEALKYDFGIAFSPDFAGTKIALFEDVLKLVAGKDVTLKIDNKLRKFTEPQLEQLFDMLRAYNAKVMISCWNEEIARRVRRELPEAGISFDGLYKESELEKLSAIAGKENFYIWVPIDYSMADWAPEEWWNAGDNADTIKKYARFCIWALESEESFERAVKQYSPYAAETSGTIKPDGYGK